jgi:LysM repeat protein
MTPLRILAPSLAVLALASCASQNRPDPYDTPAPYDAGPYGASEYGYADESQANPIYDTPAAYEEAGSAASSPAYSAPAPYVPAAPASNGAATIHTVVAGDTLSGLSAKYKVPVAEIKQANNMTNDIVVLGRKMVIPPAR